MSRTMSVSETKNQLSAVINWTKANGDDVIVESRGQAQAVIIPIEDYDLLQDAREQKRRADALQKLQKLGEELRAKSQDLPDLDESEAEKLAERFSQEVIAEMIADGKIKYSTE